MALQGLPVTLLGPAGLAGAVQLVDVNGNPLALDTAFAQQVNIEGKKASYRYVAKGIVMTANGILFQLQGSNTKLVRVTRVLFCGQVTTFGVATIDIWRTTGAVTGVAGQATVTPAKLYNANAAATAVATSYTSATLGAGSALIESDLATVQPPANGGAVLTCDFGTRNTQAIVLNGATDFMQIGLTTASFAGAAMTCTVESTEE